jgi:hypothetical protein
MFTELLELYYSILLISLSSIIFDLTTNRFYDSLLFMYLDSIKSKHSAHSKGLALERHKRNAHKGKLDLECPACADLLKKHEIFQKTEFVGAKPVSKRFLPLYFPRKNPSNACKKKNHSGCTGRHGRNHGMLGEKCSCDCHLTIDLEYGSLKTCLESEKSTER